MVKPAPVGALRAQSQGIRKGGHPAGQQRQWEEWRGLERRVPYQAGSSMACGAAYSMGAAGEEPREACGDPASSVLGLPTPTPTLCHFI